MEAGTTSLKRSSSVADIFKEVREEHIRRAVRVGLLPFLLAEKRDSSAGNWSTCEEAVRPLGNASAPGS